MLAILVALATRNVYAALGLALLASETLIAGFHPGLGALGAIDRAVGVFESPGNTRVLLFCLLIGALIAWMRDSGGVEALVRGLMRRGLASTPRRAALAPALAGTAIFVETNVSLLSSGVLGQRLFDAHGLSRERLAYIIDSTSAPISALILLNGWGAYALGLVEPYGFDSPIGVVAGTIPWNFYALLTLAGVYATVFTGRVFGPMKTAGQGAGVQAEADAPVAPTRAIYMWLPLAVMIAGALGFMAWTGGGNILAGSGSQSKWAITTCPPGRSSRRSSRPVAAASNQCQHCPAVTRSNWLSARPISAASPAMKRIFRPSCRASRPASASICGERSSPVTCSPRAAKDLASVPVPVPRSSRHWPRSAPVVWLI